MSENIRYFESAGGVVAVTLPFDYPAAIDDWVELRRDMIREVPDAFTRDEWAYLVTFLDRRNLQGIIRDSFGPGPIAPAPPRRLYRPRGPIAVWLPNNVSLLGPLVLVALSLTGQRMWLKAGSQAEDLAGAFLDYARARLPDGALRAYLRGQVEMVRAGREDAQQQAIAAQASTRIVFGSNEAIQAIDRLPHPVDSRLVTFADHQSEAWIEPGAADDTVLETLIRVFSIYGRAGCTSPGRVVLLGGTQPDALRLRDRLAGSWPTVNPLDPPMHTASANLLAEQYARMNGWDARRIGRNAALLACGPPGLPAIPGEMSLQIVAATPEEALRSLPENIQTIGYALERPDDPAWLERIARSPALRFVPLSRMHHFGSPWDGQEFWRLCFDCVEVSL